VTPLLLRHSLGTVLLLAAMAATAPAQEEREPTLAEAKAAFAKADRALNEAWKKARAAAQEADVERLTFSQREWIRFRDDQAEADGFQGPGKNPKQSPGYFTTAAHLTESRTEWLTGRAKPVEDDLTGYWIDGRGGTLRIVQRGDRLLFDIDVVRGPTSHTGSVAGIASWNARLGWWSDKGREPDKTEESNLAFIDRSPELELIGANTFHYHGVRAYFDGDYVKIAPLNEEEKAEVTKHAESGELPDRDE
jgi:uncharacterized protein YecT (DUF1311 family)